ncbi:MAG TPA: hypothetical protein VK523_07175 [Steroidobacteraceae bacterium]|nr:hypothetical protein [Steroidobacteraceae bacterium]
MKQSFLLAAVAACLVLAGCVENPHKSDMESATPRATVDKGKVTAVDAWAEDAHATVMWVNYPQASHKSSHDD